MSNFRKRFSIEVIIEDEEIADNIEILKRKRELRPIMSSLITLYFQKKDDLDLLRLETFEDEGVKKLNDDMFLFQSFLDSVISDTNSSYVDFLGVIEDEKYLDYVKAYKETMGILKDSTIEPSTQVENSGDLTLILNKISELTEIVTNLTQGVNFTHTDVTHSLPVPETNEVVEITSVNESTDVNAEKEVINVEKEDNHYEQETTGDVDDSMDILTSLGVF